jgi:hypothetical protein
MATILWSVALAIAVGCIAAVLILHFIIPVLNTL